jgi:carboxyl-terminal processing protease
VDVVDMKLNKVVELIRGKKNTEVRLTIIPADAADSSVREVVSIIRDEIKLEDQEAKARLIELPDGDGKTLRLGSIDLPSFYADMGPGRSARERKSTTRDVARLVGKLQEQNIDGLILDLRRNGGGSLEEAINLTGLFISKGPVVQVKDYDGEIDQKNDSDATVLYNGPLIVLTSRFSASASEILAGALQDYGRAVVVGDSSTHGKGTVQSLVQLSPYLRQFAGEEAVNPGALKITISKFYRASGSSTQLKGVVPDIVLPSVNNVADVGESSLENPLPWDTVPSARYQRVDMVAPHLATIAKLSGARVQSDRDFDYIREDMKRYEEIKAEKFVSLNEDKRRQEKAEAKARADARAKEVNSRNLPTHVTYEFTVTQASQPGLPEPLKQDELAAKKSHGTVPVEAADDEADADTAKAAVRDVHFEEAKRIMADYIHALAKSGSVAAVKN